MKILMRIVLVLLVVVVAGLGASYMFLDRIVVKAVGEVGPRITGTPVSLSSSALKPWSGAGTLSGLQIGNPQPFGSENIFSLGAIEVDIDMDTLREEVLLVNLVRVEQPEILYINNGDTDNLRALLANIEQRLGSSSQSDAGESEGASRKIMIDDFYFTGGRVSASHSMLGEQRIEVALPQLHLVGIGRESNGTTIRQAAEQIFEQVNAAVREVVLGSNLYDQALNLARARFAEEIQQVEAVKQQVEEAQQQLDEVQNQAKDAEQQIRGALDVFNR